MITPRFRRVHLKDLELYPSSHLIDPLIQPFLYEPTPHGHEALELLNIPKLALSFAAPLMGTDPHWVSVS